MSLGKDYIFKSQTKKQLLILFASGILLTIVGIFMIINGDSHHEEVSNLASESSHYEFHWYQRFFSNLWINNVYFTGISVSAVFFLAIQYVAQAGWSAGLIRIPIAMGSWMPYAFILMLLVFGIANHDIFHWTHEYLYDVNDYRYDAIIDGKKAYLNVPFYLSRMILFFVIWYLLYIIIVKESDKEDVNGGETHWRKLFTISAVFVVVYAVTSSVAAWDWILSIDTHWFSTMIGWYVFASWWVSSLAFITLIVIALKENGNLDFKAFTVELKLNNHFYRDSLNNVILQVDINNSTQNEAMRHLSRSLRFYYQGDFQQALAEVDKAITLQPNIAVAYARKGSIYYKLNQIDRATLNWNISLKLDPEYSEVREMLNALKDNKLRPVSIDN